MTDENETLNHILISNINKKISDSSFIVCIITLLCTLIMCGIYLVNKNLRSLTYILLFIIALSEFFNSIGRIVEKADGNHYIAAILCLVTDCLPLTILICLSHSIYDLILNGVDTIKNKYKYIIPSVIMSIVYTLAIVISSAQLGNFDLFFNQYFDKHKHEKDENKKNPFFILHYCLMLVMVIISFIFIIKSFLYIREKSKEDKENSKKIMEFCKDLFDYPLYGSLGWIFGFATIFSRPKDDWSTVEIRLYLLLSLISKFFLSLKGFLYFCLFISSKKVNKIVKRLVARALSFLLVQDTLTKINKSKLDVSQTETVADMLIYGH